MTGVNDIRSAFLDFFAREGHDVVPSSPLVPRNDPTLLFTNAGMVQFKNVFTGSETRSYKRAASAQKCVRAGGKHNDLDNVGFTARHHTFFEMLGNFSFGDYFKERAIELAWRLITGEFELSPDRLIVTVYSADEKAFQLWKKITALPESQILKIATNDNFWAMGDTGPCGPCSEIFYDHGEQLPGGPPGSPDEDGDRFVEIWNLVFMQCDQVSADERRELPKPSIDTGMGLERLAAVLQGTHDNFKIDLFRALIGASVEATDVPVDDRNRASHRIIADHLRASSFLIADGVLPANEGRGYVLRRIMRRAMRHAHLLGAEEPLLYRLVPALVREMGMAYHELGRAEALIEETLKLEETRFRKTLKRGLQLLDEETGAMTANDILAGSVAFKLYDTYGFPLDLTEDALKVRGIGVDTQGFDAAMERQRSEARKAWAGSGEAVTEAIWFDLYQAAGPTEFLGYETEQAGGTICALVCGTEQVKQIEKDDEGTIIVNQSPFYGEAGGQIGDTGLIVAENGACFRVTDTQIKLSDLLIHNGRVEEGVFRLGDVVELTVDGARRGATRANHSATHLLHEALRQHLGPHVVQKGSLVAPDRLRFDYSHQGPMKAEEIAGVEAMANAIVLQNATVETHLMVVDEAIGSGALALFGEKYGDEVRVVSMGTAIEGDKAGKAYSVELCGGTHVRSTGDIGVIKVTGESAVASGVRRIEALTGEGARAYLNQRDERLRRAAEILKTSAEDVVPRLEAMLQERKKLERDLSEARRQLALGKDANGGDEGVRALGSVKLLARTVEGVSPKDLRSLVDDGKRQIGSGIVVIISLNDGGKAGIVVGVTDDLVESYDAVELVKIGALALGGTGGGGRADLAQAGGPDGSCSQEAIEAIAARVREHGGA